MTTAGRRLFASLGSASRQSTMTICPGSKAAMSGNAGRLGAPVLVEGARVGVFGDIAGDGGALRADLGTADVACGGGGELAEIGGEADALRLRLGLQGGADVFVEPEGDRSGHANS